jgi:phytoene dehydrogenase-like protein
MQTAVIISQNPTGILAAALLERAGFDVTLIDSGNNTFSNRANLLEMTTIPSDPTAFEALAHLEEALNIKLIGGEVEVPPVYFEGNEPKPFSGFGDSKFKSVAPLSVFNFSKALALTQDLGAVVAKAKELFRGKVLAYTEVSKVEFDGDRVSEVLLNSGNTIKADFFAFCDSPREVLNLIPADMMSSRWRARILKTSVASRIKIHFNHLQPVVAPELLNRALFLIPGGTTQEPFVGQVFQDETGTHSVWQAYMPEEMNEDPEIISSTIKHMRRQLQRAFNPEEFRRENLLVAEPQAFGEFGWSRETAGFEEHIENAVLGSPLLSPFAGLMGCVEQSRRIFLAATQPQQKRSNEPTILAESTATC